MDARRVRGAEEAPRARRSAGRPSIAIALALALVPALLLALLNLQPIAEAENASFDARLRLRNAWRPQPLDDRIVLVGVTDADLESMGEELASREAYLTLLSNLRDWGASLAVFDILFERHAELDGLFATRLFEMPSVLAFKVETNVHFAPPAGPKPEALAPLEAAADTNVPEYLGELLAGSLADYEQALLERRAAMLASPEAAGEQGRELARLIDWVRHERRAIATRWLAATFGQPAEKGCPAPTATEVLTLSPQPMTAASGLGIATIDKNLGSVVRRVPLVYQHDGTLYPNLDLAALCAYWGVPFRDVEIQWGREIRIKPRRGATGTMIMPIDEAGRYLVNWREGESFLLRESNPSLRLATAPTLDAERAQRGLPQKMNASIVLVGELVSGGRSTDVEPIPLQPAFPMVGLHANVIDNALRQDFLLPVPKAGWIAAMLAMVTVVALTFARASARAASVVAALLAIAWPCFAILDLSFTGRVWPIAAPMGAHGCATVLLLGYIVGVANREKRRVRDVFLRTVSPRIGEEILTRLDDEALWGERRTITVLFVDIRGYTALTERAEPDAVLRLLDRFYGLASAAVFRHDGQVNKLMGDAVLALFGAMPEEGPDHEARAVRAAVDIQRALSALPEASGPDATLAVGAGVARGEAVTGLVGDARVRLEFTAIGDPVNLASRLQGLASTNEIVVDHEAWARSGLTAESLGAASVERLNGVTIKGKAEPRTVHRITLRSAGETKGST